MRSFLSLLFLGLGCQALTLQRAVKEAPLSCNPSVLSCHVTGAVDACCSPTYGQVVFTLQWVPGYGPANEFTIHGNCKENDSLISTNSAGGRAPSNGCDAKRASNTVATIVRDRDPELYRLMQAYWPSYKDDNNWFWSHEWTKHGTCVSTLRPVCYGNYTQYDDVLEYFHQAMDLHHDYDIYGALNLAGVIPGNTYNYKTFLDAIQKTYGGKVKLDCDRNGQLQEIGLYFHVAGRDRYQITDADHTGTCKGAVYYPKKY
ncbi:ribonuclease T2-like protein [Radiomyces spectabilis]|uniref:ribonuclease T2-like protein n=1 Tax=Radiomyces spectabilis TaxID=64574 RepID=UPI00221F82D5|nr:ribonuclease T2-like protein [Radiomyces spectabilis]KAI8374332.1 ribonuclease T2-like protein [Radiomyces spectabilis]